MDAGGPKWGCPSCMYLNPSTASECGLCLAPRTAAMATPSAPPPAAGAGVATVVPPAGAGATVVPPPTLVQDGINCPRVLLSVRVTGLKDTDGSLANPYCVLEELEVGGRYRFLGKTEVVDRAESVHFAKQLEVDYHFEAIQTLRFAVCCQEGSGEPEVLGRMSCTLSDLLTHGERLYDAPIYRGGVQRGVIHVTAEEAAAISYSARMAFSAQGLPSTSAPNKVLLVSRSSPVDASGWTPVIRSTPVAAKRLAAWPVAELNVAELCQGDYLCPLKFEVVEESSTGRRVTLGVGYSTVEALTCGAGSGGASPGGTVQLVVPNSGPPPAMPTTPPRVCAVAACGVAHHNAGDHCSAHTPAAASEAAVAGKPAGTVTLRYWRFAFTPRFLDYIRGGVAVSMVVFIDFTGSNQVNGVGGSNLHSLHPGSLNQYEEAIRSVGACIAPYDSTGQFPCFGYGATLPGTTTVSHCFALNGNEAHPYVTGIDGIMAAYRSTVQRVTLQGPTKFSPSLQRACDLVTANQHTSGVLARHFIALIITDGCIHDEQQTIDTIVRASDLPLSVIIVGVGTADFDKMDALCAEEDDLLTASWGQTQSHDIVQFVAFRDYQERSKPQLAHDVLEEVPEQLVFSMNQRGIVPHHAPADGVLQRAQLPTPLTQAPAWEKDSARSKCALCTKGFSLTRRRHHCRCCGQVLCDTCCSSRVDVQPLMPPHSRRDPKGNSYTSVRVCWRCLPMVHTAVAQAQDRATSAAAVVAPAAAAGAGAGGYYGS